MNIGEGDISLGRRQVREVSVLLAACYDDQGWCGT
jgi:hypothetical protein